MKQTVATAVASAWVALCHPIVLPGGDMTRPRWALPYWWGAWWGGVGCNQSRVESNACRVQCSVIIQNNLSKQFKWFRGSLALSLSLPLTMSMSTNNKTDLKAGHVHSDALHPSPSPIEKLWFGNICVVFILHIPAIEEKRWKYFN